MKKLAFLTILLLAMALTGLALAAAPVTNLVCTPGDHRVGYSFDAPDYNVLLLSYRSQHENGQLIIWGKNGHFEGSVSTPCTYNGNYVYITISTVGKTNRTLVSKYQTNTEVLRTEPVEQAANGRLSGVTICVDPGHQGVSIGLSEPLGPGLQGMKTTHNGQAQGVFTKRLEGSVVLEIGLMLRDALLREGATVVMTRDDMQTPVSNVRRAEIATEANADLMIRLHLNSVSNNYNTGIQVYIPLSSTYAKQVADPDTYKVYAAALLDALKSATGAANGDVRANNDYIANNWATMPCFLVEMGYMTTISEDILLSEPLYQEKLVKGMVEGLIDVAKLRGVID